VKISIFLPLSRFAAAPNVLHAATDASNSLIQSLIAAFVLSIFSCVDRLCSMLESAIPTLPRASLRLPPPDKFKIAAPLAFLSVAKTCDLRVVVNRASIAAFVLLLNHDCSLTNAIPVW